MKKAKLSKIISACLFIVMLFCSCEESGVGTYELVCEVRDTYLSNCRVSVYTTSASEGEWGYFDPALVGAMLGDGGEMPSEILECAEISFLCSDAVSICEVWVARCHTATGARELYEIFEKRKKLLSMLEYELDSDREAADGAVAFRDGKKVYFAACENSDEIISHLCSV